MPFEPLVSSPLPHPPLTVFWATAVSHPPAFPHTPPSTLLASPPPPSLPNLGKAAWYTHQGRQTDQDWGRGGGCRVRAAHQLRLSALLARAPGRRGAPRRRARLGAAWWSVGGNSGCRGRGERVLQHIGGGSPTRQLLTCAGRRAAGARCCRAAALRHCAAAAQGVLWMRGVWGAGGTGALAGWCRRRALLPADQGGGFGAPQQRVGRGRSRRATTG